MSIEFCLITGIAFGVEYQELEKGYIVIDLGILRILLSKDTDEDDE